MKVFVLVALVGLASSAPSPQFDALQDLLKGIGGESSDDGLEVVPYRTLNKTIDGDLAFEVREYPRVKWACTDDTHKMKVEDVSTEDSNALTNILSQFSSSGWKKRPSSVMFMRLFRYISGVNAERQEIEMTKPVLSKMTPDREAGTMTTQMCFYLDSAAQAQPPTPEEETVYIYENEPLTVAVYEFGGYAMKEAVWEKRAAEFLEKLGDRANSVESNSYYTAGYDSPMKFWNRKNEVMFEVKP